MRVTQSMLSNNMLRNLSSSYGQMSKLQEQLTSGSKINRPSDDPVATIKGMGYRTDLNKVKQYERNMNTVHSWLDTSDSSLGEVGEALHRVKDLVVQAANDTNTEEDREKIKAEIDQIRKQIQDLANTKVADKYLFSGTNTQQPLFIDVEHRSVDGDPASDLVVSKVINATYEDATGAQITPIEALELEDGNDGVKGIIAPNGNVEIEVFDGITLQVNTPGADMFGRIDDLMGKISKALTKDDPDNNGKSIGDLLGGIVDITGTGTGKDDLSILQNKVLEARADIGARQNRVEMMENRLSMHEINVTKQMSNNEDVDYAETITEMVTSESIHQAALSVGAKILQQTLVDFIR